MKKFLLKTTPILAAALLFAGTTLFAGCEKDNHSISITEIVPPDCIYEKLGSEHLAIINSQKDYEDFFSGCSGETLGIDFQKQTLFLLWGTGTHCVLDKTILLEKNGKDCLLTISVFQGDCPSMETWDAFFVTEKLNAKVSLVIHKMS